MKTVLYNKDTEEIEGNIREGWYKVDGVRPELPENIVELVVEYIDQPTIDPQTQRLNSSWNIDLPDKKYIRDWIITDLTQEEIDFNTALADWIHIDYVKRIVAPISLIMDDIGTKMYAWFIINNLPVVNLKNGTVHLYCNNILPQHQQIIDDLEEIVSIEDIPQILVQ